jgi:hypothetical protein
MTDDPGPTYPRPRWWQWPTVGSLDAPAVALLWQAALAGAAGFRLRPVHALVLGASVWLAYAADRWIEGWRLDPSRVRTHRHQFYQRWRWPVAGLWSVVLAADLAVAFGGLQRRELLAGFLLLAAVAAYLLSHQLIHLGHRWRAPKEVCVAGLMAGGAALFPAADPGADLGRLALPVAVFAAICFANCALISVWENAVDRVHGQTSLAGQFRLGSAFSRILPWFLAAAIAVLRLGSDDPVILDCALASSLLLGIVDRLELRLGREPARVLADVALMTPAIPLALAALGR